MWVLLVLELVLVELETMMSGRKGSALDAPRLLMRNECLSKLAEILPKSS